VPKRLSRKRRPSHDQPWKGIFFPLTRSQIKKQKDETNSRRVTTVKGGMLFNAVLVAMNDAAQKKQAVISANLALTGTFVVCITCTPLSTMQQIEQSDSNALTHQGILDSNLW